MLDPVIERMAADVPRNRAWLMRYLVERCASELEQSEVQRHARQKPHEYAGDYQMIDYIYTGKADSPGRGRLWDEFFHRQQAPRSVNNQKVYFGETVRSLVGGGRCSSLLNVASGPCRDLLEVSGSIDDFFRHVTVTCVESDAKAIEYAGGLLAGSHGRPRFEHANVFKYRPQGGFDFVWSAGLFDYLPDRLAVRLLRRLWAWTNPGGRLTVGNFHRSHTSRSYMEWCGGWFLIHRGEADFRRLAREAGLPEGLSFEAEPLGACFFLVADKAG